jgi:predicted GNAT family acetyltransferase
MNEVKFLSNDKGAFVIEENGERIAEMIVGIESNKMSVYHTGVVERMQGQGIGKQLVEAMIQHARDKQYKVEIYCPFVKRIFQQEEGAYADIWEKETRLK